MKTLAELTKDERSLLLFLETRAVDYGGRVNTVHMNAEDMALAAEWNRTGFLLFGRISSHYLGMRGAESVVAHGPVAEARRLGTHWCELTADAWRLAHEERRARAERMKQARTWKTPAEHKASHD